MERIRQSRRSPPTDRLFGGFFTDPATIGGTEVGELEEEDVFWTGAEFAGGSETRFGILAALSKDDRFRRNSSPGWTIPIPIPIPIPISPKPRKEEPTRQQQSSAPVSVPLGARKVGRRRLPPVEVMIGKGDDCDEDEEEMLPPHEIVAKARGKGDPWTTFSVLEGVGRTLKGRDLRRVRNAVWRQTGFLD